MNALCDVRARRSNPVSFSALQDQLSALQDQLTNMQTRDQYAEVCALDQRAGRSSSTRGHSRGGGYRAAQRGRGSGGVSRQCTYCGRSGHSVDRCWDRAKQQSTVGGSQRSQQNSGRSAVRCYNCGGSGHMANVCPTPRGDRESSACVSDVLADVSGDNTARIAYVPMMVDGKQEYVMLDTGASVSLISKSFFSTLSGKVLTNSEKSLVSADGESMNIIGQTTVNISIGKNEIAWKVHVCDSLVSKVILGYDF